MRIGYFNTNFYFFHGLFVITIPKYFVIIKELIISLYLHHIKMIFLHYQHLFMN
jgi:hypothetical protein